MNALVAWVERREWKDGQKPEIPEFDKRLRANLDTDIRIVMSWDADATDIDLHVTEPGGEEASYGHNRTARGGMVSQDITDGYGPEEYLIRIAPTGGYNIKANYYGSRQQTIVGPATVTATVFTNWGRANEKREVLTIRLDKPDEKVDLGTITFGRGELKAEIGNLRVGMTRDQVLTILGKPVDPAASPLEYMNGAKTMRVFFDDKGALVRITETLPGGIETIDPERYLKGRSSTFAETFFLSPGVIAQSRFGSDEARMSIRGSGLQRTFHGRGIRVLIELHAGEAEAEIYTNDLTHDYVHENSAYSS
jgi:hypothetical protein